MVFPVLYIVLMFHVASRTNVLGVRRGVSHAASFRLSLHCIISLQDGDPSLPRKVCWFVVVDAFVTSLFLWVGSLALRQPLYPLGKVGPALVASYDMHGRAVGLFYTQPTGHLFIVSQNSIHHLSSLPSFLSLIFFICHLLESRLFHQYNTGHKAIS